MASLGPELRSRVFEILGVEELRLRFQRHCGLVLNQDLPLIIENLLSLCYLNRCKRLKGDKLLKNLDFLRIHQGLYYETIGRL